MRTRTEDEAIRKFYLEGRFQIDPNTKECIFFAKDVNELEDKSVLKVYISLPISGFPLEIVKEMAENQKNRLQAMGYKVITPFEVCTDQNKPYSYCMGKDIEVLLECDAIYLAPGWHESKGCTAEYEIARIYNKKIII